MRIVIKKNLAAAAEFAEIAGEYCRLIESLQESLPRGFYRKMEMLLSHVHEGILSVKKEYKAQEFGRSISHETWKSIAQTISKLTQKECLRLAKEQETLDPNDEYAIRRAYMLWNDLSEIYTDLKNGLVLWDTGTKKAQLAACWEWRFHYEVHWSDHLFRAMTTIHGIRYKTAML